MSDDCWCLHVEDEHEEGFFRPCTVDGCDCDDFDRLTGDDIGEDQDDEGPAR
jgi:hypothetical protein